MNSLTPTPLLQFHPGTLEYVRKQYDLHHPGLIDKSIDILEEWIRQQNHFVKKAFARDFLERTIILSKGSVERAKKKLDKMCTYKTLLPKYFTHDISERRKWDVLPDGLLPNLTPDHYRVYILKNIGQKFKEPYIGYYQQAIRIAEYIHAYDYCIGYIIVYDCRHANIKEAAINIDIVEFQQTMSIITEGYGIRIKAIHIITSSSFVSVMVSIIKQAMSRKLGDRVHVHKDVEELYEYLPKEILPIEYGGKEISVSDIYENTCNVFGDKKFNEYLKAAYQAHTIEELRPKDTFNEEYLGMAGTFRTLCVD